MTIVVNKDGIRYDPTIFSEQEVDDLLEVIRKRALCREDLRRQGESIVRKASRILEEYGPKPYIMPPRNPGARRHRKKELRT